MKNKSEIILKKLNKTLSSFLLNSIQEKMKRVRRKNVFHFNNFKSNTYPYL